MLKYNIVQAIIDHLYYKVFVPLTLSVFSLPLTSLSFSVSLPLFLSPNLKPTRYLLRVKLDYTCSMLSILKRNGISSKSQLLANYY